MLYFTLLKYTLKYTINSNNDIYYFTNIHYTNTVPMGTRFSVRPDRPCVPPSFLYRVFPGGKVRPERVSDHSPPFSAAVMEE